MTPHMSVQVRHAHIQKSDIVDSEHWRPAGTIVWPTRWCLGVALVIVYFTRIQHTNSHRQYTNTPQQHHHVKYTRRAYTALVAFVHALNTDRYLRKYLYMIDWLVINYFHEFNTRTHPKKHHHSVHASLCDHTRDERWKGSERKKNEGERKKEKKEKKKYISTRVQNYTRLHDVKAKRK